MLTMTQPTQDRPYADFGDQVQRFREAKGLDQEALAALLPVGRDMVRKIEQGVAKPGFETAHALDMVLDTGGAIFRAYYTRPDDDSVSTLRDEVARLALDLQSLRSTVDQLRQDGRGRRSGGSSH